MKRFSYKKSPVDFKWNKKTLKLELECYKAIIALNKNLKDSKKDKKFFHKFFIEESFYSVKNSIINDQPTSLEEKKYFLALIKVMKKKRVSNQIFFLLHKEIKKGKLGPKQNIFQYRKHQNWIGKEGCLKKEAYFFPPKASEISKKMKELIIFFNKNDPHRLIQLAIGFAQFLIIHPFMDGNGRIARAFIPFYLKQKKIINTPVILLSRFFKENRSDYYKLLFWITRNKKWENWVQFFLKGVLKSIENIINYL